MTPVLRWLITLPGSESFIGLMNGYAKKLGLTNTTFQTVHGFGCAGAVQYRARYGIAG